MIGGSGLLGGALVQELQRRGQSFLAPSRAELDLSQAERLPQLLQRMAPVTVINAAAFTDVAAAELPLSRAEVFRINRDAPAALARACRVLAVPLIHFSTDYVFDGKKGRPYDEQDSPAPLQTYGQSKLEGERHVLQIHDRALVVRTSTLFGCGCRRSRPHYIDAVLHQARQQSVVSVARLPVSSPTHAPDLASGVLDLLGAGAVGLVHLVNEGACSRLELACETVRLAGLAQAVEVRERVVEAPGLNRPDYSVLSNALFSRLTGRAMRPWQSALGEYLNALH